MCEKIWTQPKSTMLNWTRVACLHYRVEVGQGDGRYLRGWYERYGNKKLWRWSAPVWLVLPVVPGERYTLTLEIPPVAAEQITVEVRSKGWIPPRDPRTLGLQMCAVVMKTASAGTKMFNANTGE